MKSYQANELDEKTVYKLLSGSIVPRPIAWVTSQNLEGLVNVAPFSFSMLLRQIHHFYPFRLREIKIV